MSQDDKRRLRKLKRDIKRAGNKRRRRTLQRHLNDGTLGDAIEDGLGQRRSAPFNGMDQDPKRKPRRDRS
jgi:hypothetical protein